jgi:hypothetical protein
MGAGFLKSDRWMYPTSRVLPQEHVRRYPVDVWEIQDASSATLLVVPRLDDAQKAIGLPPVPKQAAREVRDGTLMYPCKRYGSS